MAAPLRTRADTSFAQYALEAAAMHMMREAHFETVFKRLDYPRHYFAKETFLYDVMYPYDVGIKERIRGISKMIVRCVTII